MNYLDIIGTEFPTQADLTASGETQIPIPVIGDQKILVGTNTNHTTAVGKSRPIVKSIKNLDRSELGNLLMDKAVVSGRALFEFVESALSDKLINSYHPNAKKKLINHAGGVGWRADYIRNIVIRGGTWDQYYRKLYDLKIIDFDDLKLITTDSRFKNQGDKLLPTDEITSKALKPSTDFDSLDSNLNAFNYSVSNVFQTNFVKPSVRLSAVNNFTTELLTSMESDYTLKEDGTVDIDNRLVIDGPPAIIEMNSELTDDVQSEMWEFMNTVDEKLKEIEAPTVRGRGSNIKKYLCNNFYVGKSILSEFCFITKLIVRVVGSSNYLEYILLDSETVLHGNQETVMEHDYDAVDELNGKLRITSYNNEIMVTGYDSRNGRPTQIPVVVTYVSDTFEDDYSFLMDMSERAMLIKTDATSASEDYKAILIE